MTIEKEKNVCHFSDLNGLHAERSVSEKILLKISLLRRLSLSLRVSNNYKQINK